MPRDQTLVTDPRAEDPRAEDRAAIVEVIRAETQAFADMDFDTWSAQWLHDERTQSVCMSPTIGLSIISGWPAIAQGTREAFDEGCHCDMARFRQENHRITFDDDMAWVVFDGWAENHEGVSWTTFETRILERVRGRWTIAYCAFFLQRDPGEQRLEISVDGGGMLVWASPGSLEALADHPVFTISAGRLRARRLDWDKVLQRELARAGDYHGFFQHQKFSTEAGGPLRYPVVLGETDDGGLAIASIAVRDGVTYVHVDGDARLGRRLQVAKAVFGLSDGQFRLAELIAGGEGLQSAADTLGISINTARTHLTRLYEKTGVHSQTALVRLLLSVG